jgi:hypothetical protein
LNRFSGDWQGQLIYAVTGSSAASKPEAELSLAEVFRRLEEKTL